MTIQEKWAKLTVIYKNKAAAKQKTCKKSIALIVVMLLCNLSAVKFIVSNLFNVLAP